MSKMLTRFLGDAKVRHKVILLPEPYIQPHTGDGFKSQPSHLGRSSNLSETTQFPLPCDGNDNNIIDLL